MKDVAAIILTAGRGTRMKSKTPKVLQELHYRPLLSFLIKTLDEVGIKNKILVVNGKDKAIKNRFNALHSVMQNKPLGSGDAVKQARPYFSKFKGYILVLYGDTPFISEETIKELIKKHKNQASTCTLLTQEVNNPSGYGRVLRDDDGNVAKIIEEKDLSIYEEVVKEINVGCYCFNKEDLFSCIDELKINLKKKEYYLTDIIEIFRKKNKPVSSISCKDSIESLGVNSKLDLARANSIIKKKVLENLMLSGVTIVEPNSTFVDMDAKIGSDTIIYPHTIIERGVTIGKFCKIGPFARIREGTHLDDNVEVGNFVELVRTKIASGTKVKHMSYLGDTEIGKNVNIGAGTITANFDGKKKNKTVIEDGAFIGVGSIFIAPVKIGYKATVGAGSVVTKNKNVPPHKIVAGVPAKLLCKKKHKTTSLPSGRQGGRYER